MILQNIPPKFWIYPQIQNWRIVPQIDPGMCFEQVGGMGRIWGNFPKIYEINIPGYGKISGGYFQEVPKISEDPQKITLKFPIFPNDLCGGGAL